MASALDVRCRSLADFLTWERQQPDRYERVSGVVRMMTGGTINHNRIALNVATALRQRLRGGSCETFVTDVKVASPEEDVMYPDVVVVCGDIPGRATELEPPVVVFEVLSESTPGPKRWAYQTIPSLEHYVLVDQDKPMAEVASRVDDGSWRSVLHRWARRTLATGGAWGRNRPRRDLRAHHLRTHRRTRRGIREPLWVTGASAAELVTRGQAMPAFKSFAEAAIEDLESAGFVYRSTHPRLAGHWHRDRGDSIEVSQVGTTRVVHRTLTREAYEHSSRDEFRILGLEVRQAPN